MIKFSHGGDKFKLRFLYNPWEKGTQRVKYREPDKRGREFGFYPYRGVTVLEVKVSGNEEGIAQMEVKCSADDIFSYRTGAELCLRKFLREWTGTRTSPLHHTAWKAFREQYRDPDSRFCISVDVGDLSGFRSPRWTPNLDKNFLSLEKDYKDFLKWSES